MQIRYAQKKDTEQLARLFRQGIESQQSRAGYFKVTKNFDWIKYAKERLSGRKGRILVAENEGLIAGFIYVIIAEYPPREKNKLLLQRILPYSQGRATIPLKPMRWGVVDDCFVVPAYREKGIASRLVESALNWFKVKKINRVELSLYGNNQESEALARKFGFDTIRLSMHKNI